MARIGLCEIDEVLPQIHEDCPELSIGVGFGTLSESGLILLLHILWINIQIESLQALSHCLNLKILPDNLHLRDGILQ